MKQAKKLASLLLALVMVLALATTAFAEDNETPGSITINGTVNDKSYELYRVFDLTYSGSGEAKQVAYTINTDWTAFFNGVGSAYIVDADSGDLNPINVNGTIKYINITNTNIAAFAKAAQAYAATKTATKTVIATSTTTVVSGLPLGYYLVYPVGAVDLKDSYTSICSLNSTTPKATVNIKATYPTIEKTADKTSADVGGTVTYTIKGKVPDTTGYSKYTYKITDTMTKGLTFDGVSSITVKIGGTAVTESNITKTLSGNGFALTIDVMKYQAQIGAEIEVTYTATVNADAITKIENNKAELEYSNNPKNEEDTEKTPPEEVKVYSAKIQINKVDGNDITKKLEGAKFVLYKNDESNNKLYYKYAAASGNTPARVDWITSKENATSKTTAANGAASFDGLADGTYYLEEIKAPNGYNLMKDPVTVTVAGTNQSEDTLTVTATVANKSGTELPSTGGIGTTIFYVLGSVLVIGAAVLLVTKKRMGAKD